MNEWGFAAEIKSWWDAAIAAEPGLGLGAVTVEEQMEGDRKRSDITLYDAAGNHLMVLELRLPDHPDSAPSSYKNIENAMTKASAVGARWSATSDAETVRLLDHSKTRPTRERAVSSAAASDACYTRKREYCHQDLWMGVFQATSVSCDSSGSAGVMSMGRSRSFPLWKGHSQ